MLSIAKAIGAVVLIFWSSNICAQEWQTDFPTAKTLAEKEDRNIILVFSGSDWCAPCIKLEKQIWDSEQFKKEASEKWILMRADFPKKKANQLPDTLQQQNAQLYEKYNKEGAFPLVVVINRDGKVLGKTAYKNISPEEYIKHLHSFDTK